jgi:hypothetical protein
MVPLLLLCAISRGVFEERRRIASNDLTVMANIRIPRGANWNGPTATYDMASAEADMIAVRRTKCVRLVQDAVFPAAPPGIGKKYRASLYGGREIIQI